MRPNDVVIWDEYLRKNPHDFINAWYDVRVGEPAIPYEDISEVMRRDWWDLLRWQIDAVCEDETSIYVIEVKPHAGAGAIGQALAYAALLKEKWKPKKPVIPAICTDTISEITEKVAKKHGVEIWIP